MDRKSLGRFEVVGVALVFPMVVDRGSNGFRGQRGREIMRTATTAVHYFTEG